MINSRQRVALLGPFMTAGLGDCIPALVDGTQPVPPGMGGTAIVNLVRARLASGRPTDIITCDPCAEREIQKWEGQNVRLWVVRRRRRKAIRDGYREERALLHKALAQSTAVICHANWTTEYAVAGLTQHRMPCVVTVHDNPTRCLKLLGLRWFGNYLSFRWVLRRTRHLTAVSPYVADHLRRRYRREATVVSNTYCDWVWNLAGERPEDTQHTVISALSWCTMKNVRRALCAFGSVRAHVPDATYFLIGPGLANGGPAHHWAESHHVAEGVVFGGTVPYRDALRQIHRSTVVFHPSIEEACPGPVGEGMVIGTPVVGAREAGGTRWMLDEGAGMLVTGKSVADMARGLTRAITDQKWRAATTLAARTRARTIFDTSTILGRWDALYADAEHTARTGGSSNE